MMIKMTIIRVIVIMKKDNEKAARDKQNDNDNFFFSQSNRMAKKIARERLNQLLRNESND